MGEDTYAGRIGMALVKPMRSQPGDSAWKAAARFGYMVVSPVIVGPAVLAGHGADEIREFVHAPELLNGFSQAANAPVRLNPLKWSDFTGARHASTTSARSAAPVPPTQRPTGPSPAAVGGRRLALADVNLSRLRQPAMKAPAPKSFGLHTPKLSIKTVTANALKPAAKPAPRTLALTKMRQPMFRAPLPHRMSVSPMNKFGRR